MVLDLETTWLRGPEALPIDQQPRIIEVGAAVLSRTKGLKKMATFNTFLNPGIPIPEESVKITGITDEMVAEAPTFPGIYNQLVELFYGCRILVAHNLSFDRAVLVSELERIGRPYQFPWPPEHICTVEETEHLKGKMLKQKDLYELATGEEANQTHRALDDVDQLITILRWIQKEEGPPWLASPGAIR